MDRIQDMVVTKAEEQFAGLVQQANDGRLTRDELYYASLWIVAARVATSDLDEDNGVRAQSETAFLKLLASAEQFDGQSGEVTRAIHADLEEIVRDIQGHENGVAQATVIALAMKMVSLISFAWIRTDHEGRTVSPGQSEWGQLLCGVKVITYCAVMLQCGALDALPQLLLEMYEVVTMQYALAEVERRAGNDVPGELVHCTAHCKSEIRRALGSLGLSTDDCDTLDKTYANHWEGKNKEE